MTRSLSPLSAQLNLSTSKIHDALNISALCSLHYSNSKIHDALCSFKSLMHSLISAFCTTQTLKSMTRSLYLLENNIIAAFSRLSQSLQIHDALTISAFCTNQTLKSMTRSLYLLENNSIAAFSGLSQRFKIHDALNISALCTTQTLKSMTRSLYLLENNIIAAFSRLSQSLQNIKRSLSRHLTLLKL